MKDSIILHFFQHRSILLYSTRDKKRFYYKNRATTQAELFFKSQLDTRYAPNREIMNRTIKMQRMQITFVRFYLRYNFLAPLY